MHLETIRTLSARSGRLAAAHDCCAKALRGWRLRRHARHTARALALLDPRTLRDIGFDRSDIAVLGAEQHGLGQATFVRTALAQRCS